MRSLLLVAAAGFTLLASVAARADTVTYDLALNAPSPFSVLGGGVGSFSVQLAADQIANDQIGFSTPYFRGSGLLSFDVTIAGETYTLPTANNADVYLEAGQVTELDFDSLNFTTGQTDDLLLENGSFSLLRDVGTPPYLESEEGTISVTQVTPEPASLLLFATGLLGGVALLSGRSTSFRAG